MIPNLDTPLTVDEFVSLKEVATGLLQHDIPADYKAKLTKLGLIDEKPEGLVLTDAGNIRLERGE